MVPEGTPYLMHTHASCNPAGYRWGKPLVTASGAMTDSGRRRKFMREVSGQTRLKTTDLSSEMQQKVGSGRDHPAASGAETAADICTNTEHGSQHT